MANVCCFWRVAVATDVNGIQNWEDEENIDQRFKKELKKWVANYPTTR